MYRLKVLLSGVFVFIATACGLREKLPDAKKDSFLSGIQKEQLEELSRLKIFFGHQSVGNNIINGIKLIQSQDDRFKSIKIFNQWDDSALTNGGIFETLIGENEKPLTKLAAFKEQLFNNEFGAKLDVAMMKFCYIDFFDDTDVHALFESYRQTINEIKAKFPQLTIIHITVPLRVHENKRNVLRHQFNLLLRKEFSAEPIFDLAKVESSKPNGEQVLFTYEGKEYPKLYKGYAKDAGHLNKVGQWLAARELLRILIKL